MAKDELITKLQNMVKLTRDRLLGLTEASLEAIIKRFSEALESKG